MYKLYCFLVTLWVRSGDQNSNCTSIIYQGNFCHTPLVLNMGAITHGAIHISVHILTGVGSNHPALFGCSNFPPNHSNTCELRSIHEHPNKTWWFSLFVDFNLLDRGWGNIVTGLKKQMVLCMLLKRGVDWGQYTISFKETNQTLLHFSK